MYSRSSLHHKSTLLARALGLNGAAPRFPKVGVETVLTLIELRRQRAHLRTLDTRLLRDIGLDSSDAQREAERAIWDVPSNWRL